MRIEQEFDFVNVKFKELTQNINKKNYKKLAFLGISMGIGLSLGFSMIAGSVSYFQNREVNHYNNMTIYAKKLERINDEEFNKMMSYYKNSAIIFDEKIEILENVFQNLSMKGDNNKLLDNTKSSLKNAHYYSNLYKNNINEKIMEIQNLNDKYKYNFKSMDEDDIDLLNQHFVNFKNNINTTKRKENVEEYLNEILLSKNTEIIKFLSENNIYDKMKEIDIKNNQLLKGENISLPNLPKNKI